jgi:hypothetical protein
MTKQPKSRSKGKAHTTRVRVTKPRRAKSIRAKISRKARGRDPLDDLIDASAHALDLKVEPAWKGAVKANLATTFSLAALFADFPLPDDAEPAPIFSA